MQLVIPLQYRVRMADAKSGLVLSLFFLASLPIGSPAALVLYGLMGCGLILTHRVPALPIGNFTVWLGLLGCASLASATFVPVNLVLAGGYAAYLLFLVFCGVIINREIRSMPAGDRVLLIGWLLFLDLAINMPAVLVQLAVWGPGDMVQGSSGLLLGDALSQNRTNSVRAGFLIVLALSNVREGFLPKLSLAFNVCVLLLATSMTTIFSGVLALFVTLAARRNVLGLLPYLLGLVGVAFLADKVNQMIFNSTSVFEFLLTINTRWIPKLDVWNQYFTEVLDRNPAAALFGTGLGNFSNRFAILSNYQNYSDFPFKDVISSLLHSPLTTTHLIDRYRLEQGIVGSSIISVPWSGMIGAVAEFGLAGLAVLAALGRNWISSVLNGARGNSWNNGMALLLFFCFNLLFDCYVDYPEVVFPFLITAALLAVPARR